MRNDSDSLMKLPTECLLHIVDLVGDDVATLQKLLTVNSFFFHASLPRLVEVWLRLVSLKRIKPGTPVLRKFLVLVVASIIHYLGNDTQHPTSCSVDEYFHSFGLQLTEKDTLEQSFAPIKEESKPTVDYTRYLTRDLPSSPFKFMPYLTVMHQFTPPPGHDEHKPSTWAYVQKIRQDAKVWQATQTVWHYSEEVYSKFCHMLLRHSPEQVTEMRRYTSSLRKYLPVVGKMAALTKLEYQYYWKIPDEDVDDLVLFIQRHRAAFPQKPPLEIVDLEGGRRISFKGNGEDEAKLRIYHNHTIQVYEALKRPRTMDASYFPEFYTRCQHIDVSHLRELTDLFTSSCFCRRRTPKDDMDMLEMFKKAVRLTKFNYSISNIGVFSKVNSSEPSETLPCLQSLELTAPAGCSIVHVLNDSMRAFGGTLKTISAKIVSHNEYTLAMDRHSGAHTLGGWNLPCIQHLHLNFDSTLSVYLGALNQCPLLTTLVIACAGAGFSNLTELSGDPDLHLAVSPVWQLPNLKELTIRGTITLHFNYDSLLNMPNLEILCLDMTWVQYNESVVATLLPSNMWDLPELQLDATSSSSEVDASGQKNRSESDSTAWPADWELPKLRSLQLIGLPSTVFSFDWIRHCPKLTHVHLDRTIKTSRCLPLHRNSRNGQRNTTSREAGLVPDSAQQDLKLTFYTSPLTSLVLMGPWVMSDSDLCKVLTDYAPNLVTLSVDRLCAGLKKDGSGFFQAIHDADKIHRSRNRQSKLTDIRADYTLKRSARLRLGLVSVDSSLKYKSAHYRCASIVSSFIVRHEDWLEMKKRN
ncbi:hypothetical protein BGZ93_000752 [Podila epicladia]|nr:hypothetical protein BGZ93_000752 [Podila epicladia]